MNLINAFGLLNMINEGKEDYQEKYYNYIVAHKNRVQKFADWLKKNCPEVFEDVDLSAFDELIREHDASKFEEPEFEAYAKHFYDDDDYSLNFDLAWEHHWQTNEHHPEHWLGENMPKIYILEMLCDWGSFSIDKGNLNELVDYYYSEAQDDDEKMLSEQTKKIIEYILSKIESIIK